MSELETVGEMHDKTRSMKDSTGWQLKGVEEEDEEKEIKKKELGKVVCETD